MAAKINQLLNLFPDKKGQDALRPILKGIGNSLSSQTFSTGGLAIKTAGSALAKTVNTVYYMANGVYGALSAADMPALTNFNITAGKYNVCVFVVDYAGTVSNVYGVEGASAATVTFPDIPEGKAPIGFIMVTYASAFTGGTTPLDTATTVYVNTHGAWNPTVTI